MVLNRNAIDRVTFTNEKVVARRDYQAIGSNPFNFVTLCLNIVIIETYIYSIKQRHADCSALLCFCFFHLEIRFTTFVF